MTQKHSLEQTCQALRRKHYALKTERAYLGWIGRYILCYGNRLPLHLDGRHLESFLSHLAVRDNVGAPTQNQALSAILFLYKHVLHHPQDIELHSVRARRPRRLPTVLLRQDVDSLLVCLDGIHRLIAQLLYGSGMRVSGCLRLRMKPVDFNLRQIVVLDGKGGKDRITILPQSLENPLRQQVRRV